jgi:peptide/nickel transport system substrate-binding protein
MKRHVFALTGASLLLGVSVIAAQAQTISPGELPDPPKFDAQGTPNFVGMADIFEYKALPAYSEPDFVKAFVDAGKLPPVAERLPKEPMVFKASNMPDGIGVYGDVMRHVIGGRPEGWNYTAGQSQGWGGIDIGMSECLTRTGPLFTVKAEELAPMPNLAKSWEWSEDGHKLTMHLIEGAKWSDGVPFTTKDAMFYWEKNVLDPNVSPLNGATPETFGEGTTLEATDDYTLVWTFKDAFPAQYIYQMAYGTFCPVRRISSRPNIRTTRPAKTYDQYKNAFPPEYMNIPVMGAWVPVEYRADDIVVLRRNPYYWKVDDQGNQLPYLNEMHYRLSTWADRDVQAVAGTGDFSNLEQAESYVEALKRSADAAMPRRASPSVPAPSATRSIRTSPAMAGASRMPERRPCASSTAMPTSASRSPRRSTVRRWAKAWSRVRSPPSIRAASMPARPTTTRARRCTTRTTSTAPRRCSPRSGSPTRTATAS